MPNNPQDMMLYWIKERENIRRLKESGAKAPWSSNRVMQETYFCNIDREDDKVTRWIRKNWTYREGYKKNYTFAMFVARIFNLPNTLELIGQPGDHDLAMWLKNAEARLNHRKSLGGTIWNGAYIVSTCGKRMDKVTYCIWLFKKFLESPPFLDEDSLEESHKALMGVEGMASFMAAQVVADLKNTKGHFLNDWQWVEDWSSFSAPGPGSLRGLSWFFNEKVTAKNYKSRMRTAKIILFEELSNPIKAKLCMQNFQNCFCEYDKFMRVTEGTGRSKRKYTKGK